MNLVISPGIFLLCFQCESTVHNGLKSEKNVQFRKNSKKVELTTNFILFFALFSFFSSLWNARTVCQERAKRGYRERTEGGKGIAILHGSLQYLYFGIPSLQKYWIINRSIRKFMCSSAWYFILLRCKNIFNIFYSLTS